MTTTTARVARPRLADRMRVPRSRGAVTGILLILLGIWGGLVPFLGPVFGYAYTPDISWHYTMDRLWMEILPGAATLLGGLMLTGTASRPVAHFGAWLAALSGLWFVVGRPLSELANGGTPMAGQPASSSVTGSVVEQIGFFYGLGAVIVLLAAYALGRLSVIGYRDIEPVVADREARRDEPATRETSAGRGSWRRRHARTDEPAVEGRHTDDT